MKKLISLKQKRAKRALSIYNSFLKSKDYALAFQIYIYVVYYLILTY